MLAADRVMPWVTTAGMVTPIGPSPISSAKLATISPTTVGDVLRRRLGRGRDAQPLRRQLARGQVDRGALDAAAADVDAEYGTRCVRVRRSWQEPSGVGRPAGVWAAWQTSAMSSYGIAEATRIVPASAADIFELLATPARHPRSTAPDTVRRAQRCTPERLSPGAKFGMHMRIGGRYKILNEVVEFEEGRRIALAAFRRPHLALHPRTGRARTARW